MWAPVTEYLMSMKTVYRDQRHTTMEAVKVTRSHKEERNEQKEIIQNVNEERSI